MRTTLSIDDDVAALIERAIRERKASLKKIINEALRLGLSDINRPRARAPRIQTHARDLGRCLIGNVDDVSESLAAAEGESFR